MTKWNRTLDGYESGNRRISDNGSGFGPAKGSGRWAVEVDGEWIANVDTLAEAKELASKPPVSLDAVARAAVWAAATSAARDDTIRAAHASGNPIRAIAKAAGLSPQRVHQILHRR